jgi:hypothetical protein
MNAEFQWWLLILGMVIGGALVYLVLADMHSDEAAAFPDTDGWLADEPMIDKPDADEWTMDAAGPDADEPGALR